LAQLRSLVAGDTVFMKVFLGNYFIGAPCVSTSNAQSMHARVEK